MLILLADAFTPDLLERLAEFGEVTSDMSRIPEAEVLIVRSKTRLDRAMLDKAASCRYIVRGGVGLDTIDAEYARSKGIIVDNTPEASSIAVAELAFAFMIAMPNHLVRADISMKEGKWLKKELERNELYGKTLGLIGIGRIGRELALRAKAFGMSVIAFDKYVLSSDIVKIVSFEEILACSDYISLHIPLIDETRGMIDASAISRMKNGVYLINTCRGQVVIEEDIADALKSGKIAGYATDVYSKEPPEGSPLFEAPNVLMTPHIGASTEENLLRLADCIIGRLRKYVGR